MTVPISSSCCRERSRSDLTNNPEAIADVIGQALRIFADTDAVAVGTLLKAPCGTKSRGESEDFLRRAEAAQRYKLAVAYLVAGWALAQGLAQVLPVFSVPNWVIQLVVVLIVLGLPVALGLAWAFELTPEGIKRTETADAMPEATRRKKYVWIYVVVIGALLSIGLFFLGRYSAAPTQNARSNFGKIDRGSAV